MWRIVFLSHAADAAKIFSLSPSATQLDTSAFPALDAIAPINSAHVSLYDFSTVPNITVNTPYNNTGPADCSRTDPAFGQTGSCSWSCNGCVRPEQGDIATCPVNNQWGLSFDDGPSPYTPGVLAYLAKYDIRATFFVVGSRVKEYPQTLVDIFNQGHQIGVHTWSHRALSTMTTPQVISELQYSIAIIKQITGTVPRYMRPPFGDIDDRIRAICKAMNLIPVMWDWDTNDILLSRNPNAFPNNQLQNEFAQHAGALITTSQGTITLQHDLYKAAADVSPSCINQILAAKTITPMPVSECIGDPTPYQEAQYVIPKSMSLPHEDYVPGSGVVIGNGSGVTTTTGSKNSASEVSGGLALISFAMGAVALLLI